jgi:hypothetical protein
MGLQFCRVAGWGRVGGIGGRVAERVRPLEKFATNSRNASMHLFLPGSIFSESELPLSRFPGRLATGPLRVSERLMQISLAKILQLSDAPKHFLCWYTNRRYIEHKVEAK